MCVQHMYNNFKKQHPGLALKERIWVAARASYRDRFAGLMESLKEVDEGAYNWLVSHTYPKEWTRSHFRTSVKCDILLNNLCESFNSTILDARQKPILDMLETIRFYLMVRIEKKREWIKKYTGEICPKILKKLEKNKLAANDCIPSHSKDWKFEVRCMYGDRYTVDLISRCCSCRKWDLNGIPCAHAIVAICDTGEESEKFVHDCYSKEAYMRAYEPMISPMNAEQMWKNSDMPPVLSPENIKLPGRPRKARRREPDEPTSGKNQNKQQQKLSRTGQMVYKCRKCNKTGHNSRKCPSQTQNASAETDSHGFVTPTPPVPKSNTQMSEDLMADAPLGSQQSTSNYSTVASIPVSIINIFCLSNTHILPLCCLTSLR